MVGSGDNDRLYRWVGQDLAEVALQLGRFTGRILDRLTYLLQNRRVHVAESRDVDIGPVGQGPDVKVAHAVDADHGHIHLLVGGAGSGPDCQSAHHPQSGRSAQRVGQDPATSNRFHSPVSPLAPAGGTLYASTFSPHPAAQSCNLWSELLGANKITTIPTP